MALERDSGCILLTGAAGFIGSHLARALIKRGRRVVGIDNFDPFYDRALKQCNLATLGDGFELIEADIRDEPALNEVCRRVRPAAVVHLAAMAGVRPSIEQPAKYAQVNLGGTMNLLEATRQSGCGVFIFGSSSSVYGNNTKVPFNEDDPVEHPISPYAATKRAGELLCHAHAHLHGMRIGMLRFFTVYGPRQRPDLAIAKFMRLMRRGRPIPMFGDGSTSRDYTYVDDIVAGILSALHVTTNAPPKFCRVWNLGGSNPVSLREMIATIEKVSGTTARIDLQPMQPGDVERTYADVSRAECELGYAPRTTFIEGLANQWNTLQ